MELATYESEFGRYFKMQRTIFFRCYFFYNITNYTDKTQKDRLAFFRITIITKETIKIFFAKHEQID